MAHQLSSRGSVRWCDASAWYRERIAIALEEFEAGDQRAAVATLLSALDGPEIPKHYACSACGAHFEWPGLLEKHGMVDCPAAWRRFRAA